MATTGTNAIPFAPEGEAMRLWPATSLALAQRLDVLIGLKASQVIDFPNIAAGAYALAVIPVAGVQAGWLANAYWNLGVGTPVFLDAWVATNGEVTVRCSNFSNAAIDPAAATIRVVARPY